MHELVHPVRAHLALLQAEGSVVVQGLLHFVAKKLTKNDTRFDVHFNKIRLGVSIVLVPATAVILLCICRAPVTASSQLVLLAPYLGPIEFLSKLHAS